MSAREGEKRENERERGGFGCMHICACDAHSLSPSLSLISLSLAYLSLSCLSDRGASGRTGTGKGEGVVRDENESIYLLRKGTNARVG